MQVRAGAAWDSGPTESWTASRCQAAARMISRTPPSALPGPGTTGYSRGRPVVPPVGRCQVTSGSGAAEGSPGGACSSAAASSRSPSGNASVKAVPRSAPSVLRSRSVASGGRISGLQPSIQDARTARTSPSPFGCATTMWRPGSQPASSANRAVAATRAASSPAV
ncbi:hypothetical protein [Actinomadura madurae]|uniref:hypothetical protein n=1 Tax=Actinomadura madurae TaxID=1993 RepID=UPI0020D233EA|nr:hypothetical protein [Actinomadura madurae]MCP9968058.1 hypothetical protein [Actinomadura madurae]MCP9980518.1 hypothetical protein [Actinomadura madurae]MCQ0016718.1 hypothetical protein [Actinomadura madurae]